MGWGIRLRLNLLKSSYFRRLYFTFLAFFLAVSALILLMVYTQLHSSVKNRELGSMKEKVTLLEPQARIIFQSMNYTQAEDIFSEKYRLSNIRFTLLAPRGEIIADSLALPETTVQGWEFKEVQQATQGDGWGQDQRVVPVFGEEALVVALALREGDKVIGVIRGEVALSTIHDLTFHIQQTILGMFLLCALLALGFGFFIAKSHARPIAQMAEVCQAIQAGDYGKKVSTLPPDELGQLGTTLNDLSQNILSKILSLSLERAQLKSMLACMQEGIISVSDLGVILFCNRSAYEHLDFDPASDLRDQNIKDIKSLEPLKDIWHKVVSEKRFKVKELNYQRGPEEKHLQVYATFYESRAEKNITTTHSGVMMVIDNHSEVKKLQKMRRDFFAHVSHELKTPLTSIQGYVETLVEGAIEDPEVRKRFLQKIDTNTQRLLSLVMDLLALNKIDATTLNVSLRPLQWLPIIQKVAENYEGALNKRHIFLEVQPRHGSILVMADRESMYTIFDNLLSNAIRYSKEKSQVKVWFSKEKGHLSLHITDTGVGIAPEHQERVFERFYRVDKARSREEGGTGLGLSIVKMLSEKLGGQVSVTSEQGIGSTFSVRLSRVF